MTIFLIILMLTAASVTLLAWQKRKAQFYTNTPYLWWLGIYVWGDALVLGPFWLGAAMLGFFLTLLQMFQLVSMFFLVRSAYEVIYWLLMQFRPAEHSFPPTVRWFKIFEAEQLAIIYQVTHSCVVILAALLLLWSL